MLEATGEERLEGWVVVLGGLGLETESGEAVE